MKKNTNMTNKKTKVTAIKCRRCGDTIFSRARHDYRKCSCGDIAIDGGFDYVKMAFSKLVPVSFKKIVNATKTELYDDWNKQTDKFGLIKELTKRNK